jgi:hypothetical protein
LTSSPADLEKLSNPYKLQRFIIDHASLLFQYADAIRTLDDDENLYIITGCIKSDSWALASFKDPPHPTNDVLKLVRKAPSGYVWTSCATAATRIGPNVPRIPGSDSNGKDQSLFLQGFKLAFSPQFRSRMMDESSHSSDASGSDTDPSDTNHGSNGEDHPGGGSSRGSSQTNGLAKHGGSRNKTGNGPSEDVSIQSFPSKKGEVVHLTFALSFQTLIHLANLFPTGNIASL